MPTDNPKISLYVPQQVYDRFKSFQEERKLSMSQAGIVILAEYFGLKETIKEITEGTTIGGITLDEFRRLKQRVKTLEDQVSLNQKILSDTPWVDEEAKVSTEHQTKKLVEQNKSTSSSQIENQSSEEIERVNFDKTTSSLQKNDVKDSELQSSLFSEPPKVKPVPAVHLSRKRFGLGKDALAAYKRKHTLEELAAWTKEKDPDNITWVYDSNSKSYVPKDELSDELLSKLQIWIKENI